MGQRVIGALHQIVVNLAAPIVSDVINELLAISRRTSRIDHLRYVTWRSEELFVPAIAPIIGPGSLRAAVHEHKQWIFFGCIKVRRLDEEAFDTRAFGTLEPEWLGRIHLHPGEQRGIVTGELPRGPPVRRRGQNFSGCAPPASPRTPLTATPSHPDLRI